MVRYLFGTEGCHWSPIGVMRCYVLVGGSSSRMGSPKADLLLGGRTFLERVTAAAREAFEEVVAVQRLDCGKQPPARVIRERPHEGTAAIYGLERAMEDAGEERFWLLALDYPLITGALLTDLRTRWEREEAAVLAPVWDGRAQMLCAGWSGFLRPMIRSRIDRAEYRLRDVMAGAGGVTVAEEDLRRAHVGEPLLNVNEPADLERARRIDEQTDSSRR